MDKRPLLNVKSLKEQVYEYLREQMRKGGLGPGSTIDMEETSKRLGVSKTPLRDALLLLETEGFVSVLPRRKVVVNPLTLQDIKDYYEILVVSMATEFPYCLTDKQLWLHDNFRYICSMMYN